MTQAVAVAVCEATIVDHGGWIEYIGPEGDPRKEAVERMNIASNFGKMPSEEDMAMCEGMMVVPITAFATPIIFIV